LLPRPQAWVLYRLFIQYWSKKLVSFVSGPDFGVSSGLGISIWLVCLNPCLKRFASGQFAGRMAHRAHKGPQWSALGLASASVPLFPRCLVHSWFLSTKPFGFMVGRVSSRNRSAAGLPTSGVVYQQYNCRVQRSRNAARLRQIHVFQQPDECMFQKVSLLSDRNASNITGNVDGLASANSSS